MNWIAVCKDGTATTDRTSERCSVVYDSGVAGWTWDSKFGGVGQRDFNTSSVAGSQCNLTFASNNAFATAGQIVRSRDSCTISISAALQAEG